MSYHLCFCTHSKSGPSHGHPFERPSSAIYVFYYIFMFIRFYPHPLQNLSIENEHRHIVIITLRADNLPSFASSCPVFVSKAIEGYFCGHSRSVLYSLSIVRNISNIIEYRISVTNLTLAPMCIKLNPLTIASYFLWMYVIRSLRNPKTCSARDLLDIYHYLSKVGSHFCKLNQLCILSYIDPRKQHTYAMNVSELGK